MGTIFQPPIESYSWNSFYRAKVIDSADPDKCGRVKIWIPDLMPEISDNEGIWARSANNPMSGRNQEEDGDDHYYQGTSYIPPKGSWLFVFFEKGNPNHPYYFCGGDFGQSRVPVECQQGEEYWKKWLIFKSPNRRTIIVSDDKSDERVEITGKKRKLKGNNPDGNADSVYAIDQNQTTILLDERDGENKILIKDYKGNFINFDIENGSLHFKFSGDINIQSAGDIYLDCKNFNLRTTQNTLITSEGNLGVTSESDISMSSKSSMINMKSAQSVSIKSDADININATGILYEDASMIQSNSGSVTNVPDPNEAENAQPIGDRNDPDIVNPEESEVRDNKSVIPPQTILFDNNNL